MQALSGHSYNIDTILLASIADAVNILLWFQTKDGQKNRNRPKSFVEILNGREEEKTASFDSIEEYEKARKQIIERN